MNMVFFGVGSLLLAGAARLWYNRRAAHHRPDDVIIRPHRWVRVLLRSIGWMLVVSGVLVSFVAVTAPDVLQTDIDGVSFFGLGLIALGQGTIVLLVPEVFVFRGTERGLFMYCTLIKWLEIEDLQFSKSAVHVVGKPAFWNTWSGRLPAYGVYWPVSQDVWEPIRLRAGVAEDSAARRV